jgi:hypothetical protein
MPTDAEREMRSGRYKGVRIPFSLQPVGDPAHADGLRWFRAGVDAALDLEHDSRDHQVEQTILQVVQAAGDVAAAASVPQKRCSKRGLHSSHYRATVPVSYCPGSPS